MRRISAKSRMWALPLLVMTMLAAACASGGSEAEEGQGAGGEEDAGPATPGGKVVYGLEAETPDGWCLPEAQLAISGIQVARSIYDTLTVPGEDGSWEPYLAESLEPNDDFTEWTIQLREGVTFHDGSELTAEVVKNNLDAFRGEYPARSALLFVFVFQDIQDITVEGPLTVKVTIKRPWPSFPSVLHGSGRVGMMAQAQLDDPDHCHDQLIGTGPFQLESWRPNDRMTLTRNENYWRTDDEGNQLPYLDELEFRPMPEADTRANALESGDIDAFHSSSITESATLREMRDLADQGAVNLTESDDFAEVGFLMLNTSEPPFDNPIAREAVALAVDREEGNELFNQGIGEVANGPFAPESLGYVEDTGWVTAGDPGRAAELVEQYEEETGQELRFTITSQNTTTLLEQVDFAADAFREAGMTVNVAPLEQGSIVQSAVSGTYQMITFRNYPGTDPDTLYVWWYGEGNPVNFMRFNDPEVNELLDRGRETADRDEREQIYQDLNLRLNEQNYMLWTTWAIWSVPTNSDVHGVVGARAPDADGAYTGLAIGHDLALMWREQ